MKQNLTPTAAFTFAEEGGYSSDPADSGNYAAGVFIGSNCGVTATELCAWMAPAKVNAITMRALTQAQAQPIFAARYWQAMNCDALPGGVDVMTCDFGYNAGAPTSAMELQTLVGADVDGWIGDQTAAACLAVDPAALARQLTADSAKALQKAIGVSSDGQVGQATLAALTAHANPGALALCFALYDAQVAHYRSLAQFPRYGNGWLGRTSRRLALALSLISAGAPS